MPRKPVRPFVPDSQDFPIDNPRKIPPAKEWGIWFKGPQGGLDDTYPIGFTHHRSTAASVLRDFVPAYERGELHGPYGKGGMGNVTLTLPKGFVEHCREASKEHDMSLELWITQQLAFLLDSRKTYIAEAKYLKAQLKRVRAALRSKEKALDRVERAVQNARIERGKLLK